MPYRDAQAAYRALVAVAQLQGGYVTAKQARKAGFDYSHLAYHLGAGNFARVGHGLYRLPEIPPSEHDQLIRLSLGSRDRNDRPQAVISHETALALHELSDVLPSKVHLTVPRAWRKPAPRGCVLHRATLIDTETEEWTGFRVTTPLRTLVDVADDGRLGREQLGRAIEDTLRRGLVRKAQIQRALARHLTKAGRVRPAPAPANVAKSRR